jgi:hypothetical protein
MRTRLFVGFRFSLLLASLGLTLAGRSSAQSLTILHQFQGGTNDGAQP